jgi:hypothetical protein
LLLCQLFVWQEFNRPRPGQGNQHLSGN